MLTPGQAAQRARSLQRPPHGFKIETLPGRSRVTAPRAAMCMADPRLKARGLGLASQLPPSAGLPRGGLCTTGTEGPQPCRPARIK